jgi:poly(3-hydroxybutyrate) depolymerase
MPLPEWLAGSTSNSVSATDLMWSFFRQHPLRQQQSEIQQN